MWEVTRTVRQADTEWVSLGVICVLLNIFAKGIRWYKLSGGMGQQAGIWKVLAAFLARQVLNLIYPVRTGDVSHILVLGKDGDQRAIVLGTVVLEKLADLVSYMLLVLLLLTLLPLPTWLDRSALGITLPIV